MSTIKRFLEDEAGFTGAEKALLTLLGLGVILVVGRIVFDGSQTAAYTTSNKMKESWLPDKVNW